MNGLNRGEALKKETQHILWDWNGTLLNDVWLCVETMNRLLAKRGLEELTVDRYLEVFGFPVKDYYARIGFDFTKEPFEGISEEYISQFDSDCFRCGLKEDAKQVLDTVAAMGVSQSILSAAHRDYLQSCVEHYGIRDYFLHLAGLEDIHAFSKLQTGRNLMQRLGANGENVLMVGDTVHDFEVATGMGCRCILVADGHQKRELLEKCNVPVVERLVDVVKWI